MTNLQILPLLSILLLHQSTNGIGDINREEETITITVHVVPTRSKLGKFGTDGHSSWNVYPNGAPVDAEYRCDVTVVRPRSAEDKKAESDWGHELMHCVYGKFHKEDR